MRGAVGGRGNVGRPCGVEGTSALVALAGPRLVGRGMSPDSLVFLQEKKEKRIPGRGDVVSVEEPVASVSSKHGSVCLCFFSLLVGRF